MSLRALPFWFISAECPELIDAIPLAIHDEDGDIEDVKKTTTIADDALDSVRYGCKSMLSPGGKPRSVEIAERLSAVEQPQEKAMLARFLNQEHKRKHKVLRLR